MVILQYIFEASIWYLNTLQHEITKALKAIKWKKSLLIIFGIALVLSIINEIHNIFSAQNITLLSALFDLGSTTIFLTIILICDLICIALDIALFNIAVDIYMDSHTNNK